MGFWSDLANSFEKWNRSGGQASSTKKKKKKNTVKTSYGQLDQERYNTQAEARRKAVKQRSSQPKVTVKNTGSSRSGSSKVLSSYGDLNQRNYNRQIKTQRTVTATPRRASNVGRSYNDLYQNARNIRRQNESTMYKDTVSRANTKYQKQLKNPSKAGTSGILSRDKNKNLYYKDASLSGVKGNAGYSESKNTMVHQVKGNTYYLVKDKNGTFVTKDGSKYKAVTEEKYNDQLLKDRGKNPALYGATARTVDTTASAVKSKLAGWGQFLNQGRKALTQGGYAQNEWLYGITPEEHAKMVAASKKTNAAADKKLEAVQNKADVQLDTAKKGLNPLQKMLVDTGYSTVQMAMDYGLGAPAKLGALPSMFMSSYGSSYMQAKQEGASETQANLYGALIGATEVGTEKLFSVGNAMKNVVGKGLFDPEKILNIGTKDYVKSAAGKQGVQILKRFGLTTTTEGAEELIAGVVEPMLRQAVYSKDPIDWGDTLSQAAHDMAIGSIMGAGFGAADIARDVSRSKHLYSDNDTVTAQIDEGLKSNEDTKAYWLAKNYKQRIQQGGDVTPYEISELNKETAKAIAGEKKTSERTTNYMGKKAKKSPQMIQPKGADTEGNENNDNQLKDTTLTKTRADVYHVAKQQAEEYMTESMDTTDDYNNAGADFEQIPTEAKEARKAEKLKQLQPYSDSIAKIQSGQASDADINNLLPNMGNDIGRKAFSQVTGVDLPDSNAGTRQALNNYIATRQIYMDTAEKDASRSQFEADTSQKVSDAVRQVTGSERAHAAYMGAAADVPAAEKAQFADAFSKAYSLAKFGYSKEEVENKLSAVHGSDVSYTKNCMIKL